MIVAILALVPSLKMSDVARTGSAIDSAYFENALVFARCCCLLLHIEDIPAAVWKGSRSCLELQYNFRQVGLLTAMRLQSGNE